MSVADNYSSRFKQRGFKQPLDDRWWMRYLTAILLILAASAILQTESKFWWISILVILIAVVEARELSMVTFVIGVISMLISGAHWLSMSVMLMIGIPTLFLVAINSESGKREIQFFVNLINLIKEQRTIARMKNDPVVIAGREAISIYWTSNQVSSGFSGYLVGDMARQMLMEVVSIATSNSPSRTNRIYLANAMEEFARLQVLVIPPPPPVDSTGLRGSPGISGQLKPSIIDICEKNAIMRSWIGDDEIIDYGDVYDAVMLRYQICHAWAHIFNHIRLRLEKKPSENSPDWFRQYLYTQCVYWENQFRIDLGLPTEISPVMIEGYWKMNKYVRDFEPSPYEKMVSIYESA